MMERVIKNILIALLYALAFTPLIIAREVVFPFIIGKMAFVRIVIEAAGVLALVYFAIQAWKGKNDAWQEWKYTLKNPLVLIVGALLVSMGISAMVAENNYRAWWGEVERAEGFFGMAHHVVFFMIAVMVFAKKEWLTFFKISLGVTGVLSFYGLLQYFQITNFPFALPPEPRPGSFVGNSAFFAGYLLFAMVCAGIVFQESEKKSAWRMIAAGMGIIAAFMIFITGTRGAILGLGAGIVTILIYVLAQKDKQTIRIPYLQPIDAKKLAMGLLAVMVIMGGIFIATRDAAIWQRVPGLNRLANTALFDPNDASTQMRILTWRVSWEAFKERPLVGWGPENYLIAYLQHYDPEMALYGETWLDRAHNKVLDIAVTQGLVGLMIYIGIIVFAIRMAIRQRKNKSSMFIVAGLVAHSMQNMFLFDNIVGYIMLFALLGYIVWNEEKIVEQEEVKVFEVSPLKKYTFVLLVCAALPAALWSGYMVNYIPLAQAYALRTSTKAETFEGTIKKLKEAFYPYNFAQFNIRGQGIDSYYLNHYFYQQALLDNPNYRPLGDILVEAEKEILQKEPYDVRVAIRTVEMMQERARTDPTLLQDMEQILKAAIPYAPQRQELYYHLSFVLAKQNKRDEALAIMDNVITFSPDNARAYYHRAVVRALTGDKPEVIREELKKVEEYNPIFKNFLTNDVENIALIYEGLGRDDKVAELVIKTIKKELETGLASRRYFESAFRYFAKKKNKESFIIIASHLKAMPELKEDMEIYIDLAEKGAWDIIQKL